MCERGARHHHLNLELCLVVFRELVRPCVAPLLVFPLDVLCIDRNLQVVVPAVEGRPEARVLVASNELVAVHVLQLAVHFLGVHLQDCRFELLAGLHRGRFDDGRGAARLVEPYGELSAPRGHADELACVSSGDVVLALFQPCGLFGLVALDFDKFHGYTPFTFATSSSWRC